eukprot:CAMPEP_0114670484 /NCGR_PEP_ID=MMETSP0191-20121206/39575_1 /TAXON_ID=126664 /ORGANISM="Sorites sp." /LENGTH=159 /DNA_ID=CAMNT_0001928115 /DNA_START=18 /DNA_END=497 /DNA_ORIENTATION=+
MSVETKVQSFETPSIGGTGGGAFNLGAKSNDTITGIRVHHGHVFDKIEFQVNGHWRKGFGGKGGKKQEVLFPKGDYVTQVVCHCGTYEHKYVIASITFWTKSGTKANFLSNFRGSETTAYAPQPAPKHGECRLVNVKGKCGSYVDSLAFEWIPVSDDDE